MSRWDRYVLRPRVWTATSRSETVPHIGPYNLQASLIATVVREFRVREGILPFHAEGKDTSAKHVFQHLIYSFNLALRLGVISGAEIQTSIEGFHETGPVS